VSEDLVITRATADDDLSEISALQARTFTNPWSAESLRWELKNTDVARLYVMRQDARVVGYCACWIIIDELHINSLAVDPDLRRRGLASRLLRAVASDAVAAGATKATLEVRRSNTPAIGLYEHLGFAVEGIRVGYYEQPVEDALILWCRMLAAV
jgi:[ribosomal protein S18]-alanine N-acetyltransferase